MREDGAGQHELIIFPGALGDLICLIPTIREIIRRAAGNPVELMARFELAQFAVARMGIVRAHSIDRPEVSELFTKDGSKSPAARAFFSNFGRVYCFFAAGDVQFRESLSAIVPETNFYPFRPSGDGHIAVSHLLEIGAEAGLPPRANLQILPEDEESAHQILTRTSLTEGEFLLILPGSGSPRKNWPAENFARLAESLTSTIKPLVLLGPAEAKIKEFFYRSGIATISGRELDAVAGLASAAKVFVGNDSGVSHLAAAVGARGVVIFGLTEPARWRPLGAVEVIRREPLVDLTVDEVRAPLLRLIEDEAGGSR